MNDQFTHYRVNRKDLGGIRNTTLRAYVDDWEQPTSAEVRALIEHLRKVRTEKITGQIIANLVGVNPRNVRKWSAPEDTSNHVRIPYAAWRLLLLYAGIVDTVD